MSATVAAGLRIGELAKRVGTTPRTIRYYEEIGLLPTETGRASGQHRLYDEHDVERLADALRLKDLLGISLEELKELLAAEAARAALRDEWRNTNPSPRRRRQIAHEALGHVERQLALVRRRRDDIAALEDDLEERRVRLRGRLDALAASD